MGHIPDGVYDGIANVLTLVSGPESSVGEIRKLAALLRRARQKNLSPEEIVEEIKSKTPKFAPLGEFISSRQSRMEMIGWLGLVLMPLSLLLSKCESEAEPPTPFPQSFTVEQALDGLWTDDPAHPASCGPAQPAAANQRRCGDTLGRVRLAGAVSRRT